MLLIKRYIVAIIYYVTISIIYMNISLKCATWLGTKSSHYFTQFLMILRTGIDIAFSCMCYFEASVHIVYKLRIGFFE